MYPYVNAFREMNFGPIWLGHQGAKTQKVL
jgi:hypothetical protein